MKSIRYFVAVLVLCFGHTLKAQNQGNVWVFGQNAGLDFNYFPVQSFIIPSYPFPNSIEWNWSNDFELGISSISDSSGKLMYFGSGSHVWNKKFQYLSGGDSLLGPSHHYGLFLPSPQNSRHYIIQAYRQFSNFHKGSGGYYSILNDNLDGGDGRVIAKNVLLNDSFLTMFGATYSESKDSLWIAFVKGGTDEICFYTLSVGGLFFSHSISTGFFFPVCSYNDLCASDRGSLKFSINGSRMSIYSRENGVILNYNFNKKTGVLSDLIVLTVGKTARDIEFAPNEKLLYLSTCNNLIQFDLDSLTDYAYSLPNVGKVLNPIVSNCKLGQLQLAPDGSILVANDNSDFVNRIRFPNEIGGASRYEENAISLAPGKSNYSLPAIFNGMLNHPKFMSTTTCNGDSTFFRAAFVPSDTLLWDFGDGTQILSTSIEVQHFYQTAGDFNVKLAYKNYQNQWDTLSKTITVYMRYNLLPFDSKLICQSDSIVLDARIPGGVNYKWNTGDTTNQITVHSGGYYYVESSDEFCTNIDSIRINQVSCDIVVPVFCESDSVTFLFPQFDSDSISFRSQLLKQTFHDSSNSFKLFVYPPGFDSVTFTFYKHGDSILNNFSIDYRKKPSPNLPNDTIFCSSEGAIVNATMTGITFYEWFPGNHQTPILNSNLSGTYSLEYGDGTCLWKDSINIHLIPCHSSHQIICNTIESTFLIDSVSVDSISWDFGNGTQKWTKQAFTTTTFMNAGNYTLTIGVHINGASKHFQQIIEVHPTPIAFMKDTLTLCFEDTLKIPALSGDINGFLWQDGSTNPYYIPNIDQLVWVQVNDVFCPTRDSLFLMLKDCDCIKYIQNAFSPNDDGLNEFFSLSGNCGFTRFTIRLYNRWGEKIFESDDPNFKWDGIYKGKALSEGVFIWVISGQASDSGELINAKGIVHLLR